jgi:superoxide reductase
MKRRDAFKKIGLASLAIGSAGIVLPSIATAQEKSNNKLIINRQKMSFADPNNPTDFELKHTPEITFLESDGNGFTKVRIHVGSNGIVHPTTENHWIDYFKISNNGKLVAHTEFENGPIRGYAEYFIKLAKGDELTVESGCNLHGIWTNTAKF